MIRKEFVNQRVLEIYRRMPVIRFPVRLKDVIAQIDNCRFMSYQELADITGTTIDDIIQICESESGCTHYDPGKDRYLILCNQSIHCNSIRRQRWTCGHEIGHVMCRHNPTELVSLISENNVPGHIDTDIEHEADYFAATLLAPLPYFEPLGVKSSEDIMNIFGLSSESAKYRLEEYQRWRRYHRKTAWENDMLKQFRLKYKAN